MTTPACARYAGYRLPAEITTQASVSKTSLVRFDNNKYSVALRAVGRPKRATWCGASDSLLPSIGEVEQEAVRIAIPPIPGDHLSTIGRVPRTSGYYIAVTHSGSTPRPAAINATLSEEKRDVTTFTDNDFHNIGTGIIRHNVVALAQQAEQLINSGHLEEVDRAAVGTDFSALDRFLISKKEADIAAFKTPDIRNILVTGSYFHNGS